LETEVEKVLEVKQNSSETEVEKVLEVKQNASEKKVLEAKWNLINSR